MGVRLRVNCIHLVPPTIEVKRWHCDMGDGREGDCPIFLEKSKDCRYKEEIHHVD